MAVIARRTDGDGVLIFSLPMSGDTVLPWCNPLTAMGPIGEAPHSTVTIAQGNGRHTAATP